MNYNNIKIEQNKNTRFHQVINSVQNKYSLLESERCTSSFYWAYLEYFMNKNC